MENPNTVVWKIDKLGVDKSEGAVPEFLGFAAEKGKVPIFIS